MKPFPTFLAIPVIVTLTVATRPTFADDGDRSFLVCDGASQKHDGQAFAFTVSLDVAAGKVLDMGSGNEPTTVTFNDAEIAAKQVVGSGVENVLQIDRTNGTFTLTITHSVKDGEAAADTDDAFQGICKATTKAF